MELDAALKRDSAPGNPAIRAHKRQAPGYWPISNGAWFACYGYDIAVRRLSTEQLAQVVNFELSRVPNDCVRRIGHD
nr:hypothetical protein [Gammaproteobacteria bacterium]